MISTVTSISEECFRQCPQMCQPLDGLITEYMATMDAAGVKAKVCEHPEPFTCMFEGDHLNACGAVLAAGSALGVELPMSTAELQRQCNPGNFRGSGAKHLDINSTNETDSNSTNVTDGGNQSGDISAAGGRGVAGAAAVRLLGLLGPVALLFAA